MTIRCLVALTAAAWSMACATESGQTAAASSRIVLNCAYENPLKLWPERVNTITITGATATWDLAGAEVFTGSVTTTHDYYRLRFATTNGFFPDDLRLEIHRYTGLVAHRLGSGIPFDYGNCTPASQKF